MVSESENWQQNQPSEADNAHVDLAAGGPALPIQLGRGVRTVPRRFAENRRRGPLAPGVSMLNQNAHNNRQPLKPQPAKTQPSKPQSLPQQLKPPPTPPQPKVPLVAPVVNSRKTPPPLQQPPAPHRPLPALPVSPSRAALIRASTATAASPNTQSTDSMLPGHQMVLHLQLKTKILHMEEMRYDAEHSLPLPRSMEAATEAKKAVPSPLSKLNAATKTVAQWETELFGPAAQQQPHNQVQQATLEQNVYEKPAHHAKARHNCSSSDDSLTSADDQMLISPASHNCQMDGEVSPERDRDSCESVTPHARSRRVPSKGVRICGRLS